MNLEMNRSTALSEIEEMFGNVRSVPLLSRSSVSLDGVKVLNKVTMKMEPVQRRDDNKFEFYVRAWNGEAQRVESELAWLHKGKVDGFLKPFVMDMWKKCVCDDELVLLESDGVLDDNDASAQLHDAMVRKLTRQLNEASTEKVRHERMLSSFAKKMSSAS